MQRQDRWSRSLGHLAALEQCLSSIQVRLGLALDSHLQRLIPLPRPIPGPIPLVRHLTQANLPPSQVLLAVSPQQLQPRPILSSPFLLLEDPLPLLQVSLRTQAWRLRLQASPLLDPDHLEHLGHSKPLEEGRLDRSQDSRLPLLVRSVQRPPRLPRPLALCRLLPILKPAVVYLELLLLRPLVYLELLLLRPLVYLDRLRMELLPASPVKALPTPSMHRKQALQVCSDLPKKEPLLPTSSRLLRKEQLLANPPNPQAAYLPRKKALAMPSPLPLQPAPQSLPSLLPPAHSSPL